MELVAFNKKKMLLQDIWYEMTKYYFKMCVFSDTMLCCLANSYCCFRGSKLLPNQHERHNFKS